MLDLPVSSAQYYEVPVKSPTMSSSDLEIPMTTSSAVTSGQYYEIPVKSPTSGSDLEVPISPAYNKIPTTSIDAEEYEYVQVTSGPAYYTPIDALHIEPAYDAFKT